MEEIRKKEKGWKWDIEKNLRKIEKYKIEEKYEVIEEIEREDMDEMREEIGDILIKVVLNERMEEEKGYFEFGEVVEEIKNKMIRRKKNVLGDEKERREGMEKG